MDAWRQYEARALAENNLDMAFVIPDGLCNEMSLMLQRGHYMGQQLNVGAPADFECSWRNATFAYARVVQPFLSTTRQRQLHDALELAAHCGQAFVAWTCNTAAPSVYPAQRERSRSQAVACTTPLPCMELSSGVSLVPNKSSTNPCSRPNRLTKQPSQPL